MCKLSLNVVPNVYNSLQSSFLSLAWPWSGRSLPKGNQWEWQDPGQGPLPGLGEVVNSPRGTSGSAGTLDWGPMWLGSQSTCHPQCPLAPLHPFWSLHPHIPMMPLQPLLASCCPHPCQWECWDPGLGPNVVGLPVHLPPQCPVHPYTPCQPPDTL